MINNSQRAFSRFLISLLCTVLVFSGVPFSPASGQSGGTRISGAKLPDLNKTRNQPPTPPVKRPPKPATRCRHFDDVCRARTRRAQNVAPAAYESFKGLWARADRADVNKLFDWRASNESRELPLWANPAASDAPFNLAASVDEAQPSTAAVAAQSIDDAFAVARVHEINRTGNPGEDLYSGNYRWSRPLVSLPGRAGFDLNLTLYYNSLMWLKSGTLIRFDPYKNWLSPGFSLGFPSLKGPYYNAQTGLYFYLMLTPAGGAVELRQISASPVIYEARDGSYTRLTFSGPGTTGNQILTMSDGLSYTYTPGQGIFIKDRNGNYMYVYYRQTIYYTPYETYDSIVDSLGRSLKFHYGTQYNDLQAITQNWDGQPEALVTFEYNSNLPLSTNFSTGLTWDNPPTEPVRVLERVNFRDGSNYKFIYNTYGQVTSIEYYGDGSAGSHHYSISYNLPANAAAGQQDDCPRFTKRTDYGVFWGPDSNPNLSYDTNFCFSNPNCIWKADHTWGSVTTPDGTKHQENFATADAQRGLPLSMETYENTTNGLVRRKWTTNVWEQGGGCVANLAYPCNPRVTETTVHDDINGNGEWDPGIDKRRRVSFSYGGVAGNYNLPGEIIEYKEDATNVLRKTTISYEVDSAYLDKRIIGLPKMRELRGPAPSSMLLSKVQYFYDGGNLQSLPATPTMHRNPAYTTGRGNLTKVRRYDVTSPDSPTAPVENEISYFITGAVASTKDGVGHETKYDYTDKFLPRTNTQISTNGLEVSSNKYNTFAYPTKITDPDLFETKILYHYALGIPKGTIDPKGAAVRSDYDIYGRLERVTNENNGAYTRYVYDPAQFHVITYTTIEAGQGEFYAITALDGHGRPRGSASEHPGSVGAFKAVRRYYDGLGRTIKVSNPTEIDYTWTPAGEDAVNNPGLVYYYMQQTYDWNNRPLVTINQDGTMRSISYDGCGCAGGQTETISDEGDGVMVNGTLRRRKQRLSHDVPGRVSKIETLDWDGNIYATTINSYNERDQLTSVKEYQGLDAADGSCPSSTCQQTTLNYDGHGRLQQRKRPIESVPTIYSYFKDDTVQTMTDARGASATYGYNGRHLVQNISYGVPSGVEATPNVTFGYDAAGNRTLMQDGLGQVDYLYDTLSRMTEEKRTFSASFGLHHPALPGTYKLNYLYNLAGQVKNISYESSAFYPTDNSAISYTYDKAGQMTGVTGSPAFAGFSNYSTGMSYFATGELKALTYGNNFTLTADRTVRQQVKSLKWKHPGGASFMEKTYHYDPDGKIKFSDDALFQDFDRAFRYEHTGRLAEGWTGAQARNYFNNQPVGTEVVPYHLMYGYDVWGNQLSETGKMWSEMDVNQTVSYQNQRRSGWSYDAAGNVTSEGNIFKYDAAGRNTAVRQGAFGPETTQQFDGDGLALRRDPQSSEPIFYIRSTMLGGKVIVEINGMGTNVGWVFPRGSRLRSYVYYGEMRVATQFSAAAPALPEVQWQFIDPLTGTEVNPSADGTYIYSLREPDPHGINVSLSDPASFPPPPPNPEEPTYSSGSWSPLQPRYTLDGVVIDAAFAKDILDRGAAVRAPANEVITIVRHGQTQLARWQAYGDGYQGYVPVGAKYLGGGVIAGGSYGRGFAPRTYRTDTNLGVLNGAIGDTDLGRSLGGFGFQQGGGQRQSTPTPTPSIPNDCYQFADSLAGELYNSFILGDPNDEYRLQNFGLRMANLGEANTNFQGHKYKKGYTSVNGFRPSLIDNGQDADVYRHILFTAGHKLTGSVLILEAFVMYDKQQAFRGRKESETELRDDYAGMAVGDLMVETANKGANGDYAKLVQQIRAVLCK